MKVVCSYCDKSLGDREPLEDPQVSHGICEACFQHFSAQARKLRLGEYLDELEVPALVIEKDRRVLAANQRMADLLGKPNRELCGLLGGEALECAYARRPERCGGTLHCKTCAIRIAIEDTLTTGVPRKRTPAYLQRADGSRILLYLSTQKILGGVQVFVEETDQRISP